MGRMATVVAPYSPGVTLPLKHIGTRDSLPNVKYILKISGVHQRQRNSDSLKWTLHMFSDTSFICGKDSRRLRISNQDSQRATSNAFVIRCEHPQNADLPRYYSKREKKPFPIPILELRRAARERQKKLRGKRRRPMPPPKNGMLVKNLVPVAYDMLNARIMLINNLRRLIKVVTVYACKLPRSIPELLHRFCSC